MFKLEPLSTTNLISIVQLLAVSAGFYFSWRSLDAALKSLTLGTKNAQAQLFNQIVVQGRDLQYKFMDFFLDGNTPQETKLKQRMYTGTIIGYYASCFELKKVLALPPHIERLLEAELRELLREKSVREKWDEVKQVHSQEFVRYVDNLRGTQ